MTLAAKISATELTRQVNTAFVEKYFEAALIYAPGVTYNPGLSDDAVFLAGELPVNTGGYLRSTIYYAQTDLRVYADDGVAMAPKAATFSHNGNNSEPLRFTHVAFLRGNGNIIELSTVVSEPSSGTVDGVYEDVPITSAGVGYGATCTLTISGSVHSVSIDEPGYGYTQGQNIVITGQTLQLIGANDGSDPSSVNFTANQVSSGGGSIVSVAAPTNDVLLSNGNQAIFYFNLKQFGYYNTSS